VIFPALRTLRVEGLVGATGVVEELEDFLRFASQRREDADTMAGEAGRVETRWGLDVVEVSPGQLDGVDRGRLSERLKMAQERMMRELKALEEAHNSGSDGGRKSVVRFRLSGEDA